MKTASAWYTATRAEGSKNGGAIRMELDSYLSERLKELKIERSAAIESLELINDKIARADAKREAQPETEHYHKWSAILRRLESDLDKAKILLTSIEAEIFEKGEKLSEYQRRATEEREYREKRLQEILHMNPDELSKLLMQDMALLQEYELSLVEEPPETTDETVLEEETPDTVEEGTRAIQAEEHVSAPVEERPRLDDASAAEEPPSRERGDSVFLASDEDRRTFGKVLTKHAAGGLQEVTFEEYEIFLKISAIILQNPAGDERSVRVKDTTSAALRGGSEECKRLLAIMSAIFSKEDLNRAAS